MSAVETSHLFPHSVCTPAPPLKQLKRFLAYSAVPPSVSSAYAFLVQSLSTPKNASSRALDACQNQLFQVDGARSGPTLHSRGNAEVFRSYLTA